MKIFAYLCTPETTGESKEKDNEKRGIA